jgi:hypothetical protein
MYATPHRCAELFFMELVNYRPKRAVIRCKAKMQLLEAEDGYFEWDELRGDGLLEELAATLFRSNRYQMLYQQCRSKLEAYEVGDRLAQELAESYRWIMRRRQDSMVQDLNALLG